MNTWIWSGGYRQLGRPVEADLFAATVEVQGPSPEFSKTLSQVLFSTPERAIRAKGIPWYTYASSERFGVETPCYILETDERTLALLS